MFAKLKKKIEEESQTDLSKSLSVASTTSSPRGSSRQSSPIRERRLSASSTDSKDSRPSEDVSEDFIRYKSEQVKRLNTRLQEYYNALQMQLDLKMKLEAELANQKLITTSILEKTQKEYELKINNLEAEKSELIKQLDISNMINNSIIEKQDDIDELEGFKTQEIAKVKHLLLNCQQDLQSKDSHIWKLDFEIGVMKSNINRLENENKVFQEKLQQEEFERAELKEKHENSLKIIEDLENVKDTLTEKLAKQKEELETVTIKYQQTNENLAQVVEQNDSIHHSHEIYVQSTNKINDENSSLIEHLKERVKTLEKRLNDSSLGGDEQYNAVVSERVALEVKLEESRQHLMDIKSTWSEKIMALEKQVSHLNNKIVEDSEEMQRMENITESSRKIANEKLIAVNKESERLKAKLSDLKKLLESREEFWSSEKHSLENELQNVQEIKQRSEKEFSLALEKVRDEIVSMEMSSLQNKAIYEEAINEQIALHKAAKDQMEYLSRINTELQEREIQKDKLIDEVTSDKLEIEKSMKELESALASAKLDTEKLIKDSTEKDNELKIRTENLERENEINERINVKLKESQDEQIRLQKLLQEKINLLETSEKDIQQLKEKLSKTEELSQGAAENSAKLLELNKSVAVLENELLERNKTIKLQQQRLSDMKKTLLRELKMQAIDVNNGDFSADNNSRSINMGPSGSIVPKDAVQADFLSKLQSLDTNDPMFEDINFRYLRHVILKFMTSREYEAQHLIKAISVLLHFTPEEEELIRDTLEWKMSWFGSKPKPKFGSG